jgi:hypothetical protein
MPALLTALTCAAASIVLAGFAAPAQAANAWGTIGNYHSGECLDDTGHSTTEDTQMQQWACLSNDADQQWRLLRTETVTIGQGDQTGIQVQVEQSGMCLDMDGGSSANGAHVIQYPCSSSDQAQYWLPQATNISGYFNYVNVESGTCMTVSADSQSSGALIQGWSCATAGSDHSYFWSNPPGVDY